MRRLLPRRLASSLVYVASLAAISTSSAAAITAGGFSAYPTGKADSSQPYFIYHTEAGRQLSDSLTIVNLTNQIQQLQLYPVDALNRSDGSFALLPEGSQADLGGWIRLSTTNVSLKPGASQQVLFNMQIPVQATVGPHYGGIIVQPAVTQALPTSSGTFSTIIRANLGVRIYETVPGQAMERLKVDPPQVKRQGNKLTITVQLYNQGNTLLAPTGSLTVRNTLGISLANQSLAAGQLFRPGDSLQFRTSVTVPAHLPQHYHVVVRVHYGTEHLVTSQTGFWVQGQIVALLVFLLLGSGSGVVYWLLRRRLEATGPPAEG